MISGHYETGYCKQKPNCWVWKKVGFQINWSNSYRCVFSYTNKALWPQEIENLWSLVNCNYSLFSKLQWSGDSVRNFRSLSQAPLAHLFTTDSGDFTVSFFYCWTSSREAVNTKFCSPRFDRPGIETESILSLRQLLPITSIMQKRYNAHSSVSKIATFFSQFHRSDLIHTKLLLNYLLLHSLNTLTFFQRQMLSYFAGNVFSIYLDSYTYWAVPG